jgi:alkanesulfonate monooxygenase SsuD/methylene tetrahydromethanopterin reductase-like flavin-dependent oxidoreductase (luciferase family)
MRWTRVRRQTTGAHADGQAVWSWRPDAGAKFAKSLTRFADDGGKKARFTEESAE